MMGQLILPLLFKIFKMKPFLIVVSFFVVGISNAQIMPMPLIANNNAYPATISANTSFDIESATTGLPANTYPAIKSNFSFNFTQATPYTFQFTVTKLVQNNASSGFIGFTTSAEGLNYSAGSFLFYEYSGSFLRNYIKNEYYNDNIPLASFALGTAYQITTTYDGTNWRNYVNGQFKNTSNRNGLTFNTTANLMLGNVGGFTNIVLDEVRFWNKALTAAEITSNWRKPLTGTEDGLKLYYNFNNQGYATDNNTHIKFLKDQTANNNHGTFTNMSLSGGSQKNFVTDISQVQVYDSAVLTIDANILDSYPGNGRGTSYGNTNNKSAFIVHDLFSNTNLFFYKSSSYDVNQLAGPILMADGGRSLLIDNIYGKTNNYTFISGYNGRSIEAWVKFNSLNNNSVVSIGSIANYDLFEMAADDGKLLLNIGVDFSSKLNLKSNQTLASNKWYHIVIEYDPLLDFAQSGFFNIFINGVLDNDWVTQANRDISKTSIDAFFTQYNTTNTNILVGNSQRAFNGKLGSLKVFKRVLNPTEVQNRFNATKSRFGY